MQHAESLDVEQAPWLDAGAHQLPAAFCHSDFSDCISECPLKRGEKGAVLHKQELHTGVSTSFGYRDFLRVIQWFGAAANICVNMVPYSPVPHALTTRSWAAAGVGIFAGQLKERALDCTSEQRAELWAKHEQRYPSGY